MKPNVQVNIEELVLHGFDPGDRHRIGAAVERELARLFAEENLPSTFTQGGHVARLDGGAIQVAAGAPADRIGSQIAQAVYGGVKRA